MRCRRFVLLLVVALLVAVQWPGPADATPRRFFPETGYAIDNPEFLNYFDRRGGVRTFGYPVSRQFILHGFPVQIFQRAVMQRYPDGRVGLMNLLDLGMLPYTQFNNAAFPGVDEKLVATAPKVGTPDYHRAVLEWIRKTAPDEWNGLQVGFHRTFAGTVRLNDAFPDGKGDSNLLSGFNLEIWGLPTSQPTFDPQNKQFVYQRFQRGIMHYDQKTGATQGILIADYFKSILMGEALPSDLAAVAKASPYYAQYNPLKPKWVDRPEQLLNTDLTRAFESSSPIVVLDPGHGGTDIGSAHTFPDGAKLIEKELTLQVASRAATLLREKGYRVLLTRTTSATQSLAMRDLTGDGRVNIADDLQARIDLANKVDAQLFLSIHFNGHSNPEMRGTSVYYNSVRPFARRSRYFSDIVQRELLANIQGAGYQPPNLGVLEDSRAAGAGQHFYVLGPHATRPSEMPGALAEGLFLSSPQDAQQLRNPKILEALAQGYARSILLYFGDAE